MLLGPGIIASYDHTYCVSPRRIWVVEAIYIESVRGNFSCDGSSFLKDFPEGLRGGGILRESQRKTHDGHRISPFEILGALQCSTAGNKAVSR